MTLFWRMVLAHLLADFTLQFSFVAKWKREKWFGMPLHCLTHFFTLIVLTWPFLGQNWAFGIKGWVACAIITIIHYVIDIARVFAIRHLRLRDGLALLALDQILHYAVLFMFYAPVSVLPGQEIIASKWFIIFSLFVLASHASSVLIYYFDKEIDSKIVFPSLGEQYFLIAERIVLMLFFFLPGIFWMPFAFLWSVQLIMIKTYRVIDISMTGAIISFIVPIVCGTAGRIAFYGHF